MAIFNFRKKDKRVIDLTERYRRQQERAENIKRDMQTDSRSQEQESSGVPSGMFSIFGGSTPSAQTIDNSSDSPTSPEDKRRRLTKRLLDMTTKIEELSNQIYHLQQRIEVLEKKTRVSEFE